MPKYLAESEFETDSELNVVLLYMIITLYPAWYWVCLSLHHSGYENLTERVLASLPAFFSIIALRYFPATRKYSEIFLLMSAVIIMWHIFRLIAVNGSVPIYLTGCHVAFIGMVLGFSKIKWVFVYCLLVVLGCLPLLYFISTKEVSNILAALVTLSIIIFSYTVIKVRLLERIKLSEKRLHNILQNLPIGTLYKANNSIQTNRAFRNIFGLRENETIDSKMYEELKSQSQIASDRTIKFKLDSGKDIHLFVTTSEVGNLEIMNVNDETERVNAQTNMLFA